MSRYIDLDQIEFLHADGNKEFNRGVDNCINRLLKAEPIEVVSLDKVKQVREEIYNELNRNIVGTDEHFINGLKCAYGECLTILDELIESENKE